MRKLLSLLFISYMLIGCSASYQAKVRDRINNKVHSEVSNNNKNTEVLVATSEVKVSKDAISDYVDNFKNVAMENMATYGIPASIKLAQAILESGSGKGKLAQQANNHFGIKCHTVWNGESVLHTDDAPDECFRKYSHPTESFNDHSLFLTSRAHYRNLFKLEKDDYKAWAVGLKNAGYATDPEYSKKLISLIERYQLDKYDRMVLNNEFKSSGKKYIASLKDIPSIHIVQAGETLYRISVKYNLSVEEIQRLNSLSGNTISVGQELKLK